MTLRTCIANVFLALIPWLLVVVVPGMMLTLLVVAVLTSRGLYDPIIAPNHNADIAWGFWVVMAGAYVPVYRVIAQGDSDAE